MVPAMQKAGAIVTNEGGMTCFSGKTKILTTKGFLDFSEAYEKLQNEDLKVLSFNPKTMKTEWKRALNPLKRKAKTWKVSISQTGRSKTSTVEMTPDHKMVTLENRKIVERELKNLILNKEMVCVADYLPPNKNPHVLNEPDKAYLCGAIFTDGYVNHNQRRGYTTFTQKDIPEKKEFIHSVKERFSKVFDSRMAYSRVKSTSGIIRGKEIKGSATDFINFRKAPAQELSKIKENMVDWVLHLDDNSLKNFLAGVIDGDGSFNITHKSGRIHIYASKNYLAQGIILACLRLGISPQVSKNRDSCFNIQIVENLDQLLSLTKRVKGSIKEKKLGTKLFSARQLFSDITDEVNVKGKIKPSINNNLLLDGMKISRNIMPLLKDSNIKTRLKNILNSDFRMQRLQKLEEQEVQEVYNFEVEDNHTYVVFTENYAPLIVWNCHAAIVSREMGTPCIVGTVHATSVLQDRQEVTVYASKGVVYAGKVEIKEKKSSGPLSSDVPETKTKIKVILDIPDLAEKAANSGADGVGLVRTEIMVANGGIHPAEYIRQGREEEYVALLKEGIGKIAKAFKGKPVWIRCTDMRSDEYRNLEGGDKEPKESDPMIGWHGIRRLLDDKKILRCEFQAIRELHYEGIKNIGVMIPFVIRVEEVKQAKEIMRSVGLEPCSAIDFGVMIETPAACWVIEDICKEGVSFVSFGTNDLTQLTLGIDRNNAKIAKLFDEMHPAVLNEIAQVMRVCRQYDVPASICGQAGSRPEMAAFLVHHGVASISSNVDAVDEIRRVVSREEEKVEK